ncbi:hypothetical protein ACPW7J_08350 [Ihubacter sp. rT4E-8]|uniref:hypothetical protein n=1 Tax=Ihubacter sp. rT4E-8 TaxID=3242369 RepID=UPI003CF0F5E8
MNRKIKIVKRLALCCAVILVILAINSLTVPKVELKSEDGRWRAIFFRESLYFEDWEGTLVYEGVEKIDCVWAQTSYNGELLYAQDRNGKLSQYPGHIPYRVQFALGINEEKPVFYTLVSFGDKPKEIAVLIQWEENGQKYETTLKYSK